MRRSEITRLHFAPFFVRFVLERELAKRRRALYVAVANPLGPGFEQFDGMTHRVRSIRERMVTGRQEGLGRCAPTRAWLDRLVAKLINRT